MAIVYKESRNISASILYYIEQCLIADGLTNYSVLKVFKNVYTTTLPIICVGNGIRQSVIGEIGSRSSTKNNTIYINIFAKDEAGKQDIKDWLIDILVEGCDYFEHTAETNGEIHKVENGKIVILKIEESEINLGTDKSQLDEHDRNRTLLNLTATTGRVS